MSKSMQIVGTGKYLPPQIVSNDEILGYLAPKKPTGELVEGKWLEEKFGVITRHFDFDFALGRKKTPAEGGIYDTDMAVNASRLALADAGLQGSDIDTLIHVTCTPDRDPRCLQNMVPLARQLGIRSDANVDYQNLGCAGLSKALRLAKGELQGGLSQRVLIVASNTPSAQLVKEYYQRTDPGYEWAWLSPAVFADGASAIILEAKDGNGSGLLATNYMTDSSSELVMFPGGGGLNFTKQNNLKEHVYLMDVVKVNQAFPIFMKKNLEMCFSQTGIKSLMDFKRIYIHQANGRLIKLFCAEMNIPLDKAPITIDAYGNTSAASTLIMFDEDRTKELLESGDLVLFLWIGAGVGAMHGYAVFQM